MPATVQDAVAERLAGDDTLTTLLAQYDNGPAIFPGIHVPADVSYPLIAIIVRSATSDGTKTHTGYDWRLLIRCFGNLKQQAEVDAVALRVRELMHRNPVDVGDMEGWLAVADAPAPVAVIGALCQEVAVRLRAMGPSTPAPADLHHVLLTEDGERILTESGEPLLTEA